MTSSSGSWIPGNRSLMNASYLQRNNITPRACQARIELHASSEFLGGPAGFPEFSPGTSLRRSADQGSQGCKSIHQFLNQHSPWAYAASLETKEEFMRAEVELL